MLGWCPARSSVELRASHIDTPLIDRIPPLEPSSDEAMVLATVTIQKVLLADGTESVTYDVSDEGIYLNELLALLERVKLDAYMSTCEIVIQDDDDDEKDDVTD